MAEDDADDAEADAPVQLGEGEPVEGAPLARVLARLHFGIEASEVERRAGDTVVRTPEGPRELGDILDSVEETYFPQREALESVVREVVGTGAVPTGE